MDLEQESTFTSEYERLSTDTPAHADVFNKIYDQLFTNDTFLKQVADSLAQRLAEGKQATDSLIQRVDEGKQATDSLAQRLTGVIDGTTTVGKATTLDGLITNIGTLNLVNGAKSNIQSQIDNVNTGLNNANIAINRKLQPEDKNYLFVNKNLNSCNIDPLIENCAVALSESGHGTAAFGGWENIITFFTTQFLTQLSFTCNSGQTRLKIRDRYAGSSLENVPWSAWNEVLTERNSYRLKVQQNAPSTDTLWAW